MEKGILALVREANIQKVRHDKFKKFAVSLGVEFSPELMKLGSEEAISNSIVENAFQNGISEEEIAKAL